MRTKKIHNKGQARLFQNPFLESLTQTHPLVIWGMYIPIMAGMLYYAGTNLQERPLISFSMFLAGMFFRTFFEYVMHRFIYHANHHEYLRDRQRLFLPPVPSILIAPVLFTAMHFMGNLLYLAGMIFSFFHGFILGYLLYASMHYAIHAWNPPFKWMKPLWRNHTLHHYKIQEKGFGVSSILWDHVFGTMFRESDKSRIKNQPHE